MSGLLAPPGSVPNDETMLGVSRWILEDGVTALCPEGMRQFARGVLRLLGETPVVEGEGPSAARVYPAIRGC